MGSLPDVTELRTRLENTLLSYHSLAEEEWRVAKKSKDVTVWRKPSTEFNGFLYKAQGLVMETPQRIVDYIRPGPYRLEWDSLMTSMDIVETLDKTLGKLQVYMSLADIGFLLCSQLINSQNKRLRKMKETRVRVYDY